MTSFFDTTYKTCEPLTEDEMRAAWKNAVDAPPAPPPPTFLSRRDFAFAAKNGLLEAISRGWTIIAHPEAIEEARREGWL